MYVKYGQDFPEADLNRSASCRPIHVPATMQSQNDRHPLGAGPLPWCVSSGAQSHASALTTRTPWRQSDDACLAGIARREWAPVVFQKESRYTPCWKPKGIGMKTRADIQQGTLALMVLKTLDVLGPLHGYGIARRIEQISGDQLALNQGTLYPLLLRLEQEGAIASEWGPSENNRRARFYRLTRGGRKQLQAELRDWQQTTDIIARFLAINEETQS